MNLKYLRACTALGAILFAVPALAQEQVSEAGPEPAEEVVEDERAVLNTVQVFARKRQESVQDIPVVVQAFDAGTLERNAVSTIEDISFMTPGLTTNVQGNNVQNVLNMRGIESGNVGVGFDQAVSVNIDGVQFSNSEFLRVGQFDLERAEVLKGPQALYNGKNSTAGIIALKTADPTDELYTEIKAGYASGADRWFAEGVLSGPISDTVGGRLAVSYTDADGWWENQVPGVAHKKLPNYNELIARGTLQFEPTDNFDATAKLTYHRNRGDDHAYQELIECTPAVETWSPYSDCTLNGKGASVDPDALPGFDPSLSPLWRDEPYSEYNTTIFSVEANYDINDDLTLSSVTGYSDLDNQRFDNIIVGGTIPLITLGEAQKQETFSQELRLSGTYDRFNFMVGAYYDDRTITQDSAVVLAGGITPFNTQEITADSWSAFAQFEYDVTDEFSVSVGGRYTEEDKSFRGVMTQGNGYSVGGVPVNAGDPFLIENPSISADDFSPEITLSYKPQSNINLFASYKEGFKSGSFSMSQTASRFLSVIPAATDFAPEEVDGYEIGAKTEWLDNRLRLNLVWFDYDYSNLQLSAFDSELQTTRVFNAGAAKTRGIEFESMYIPENFDALTLSANIAYLDAYYEEWDADCTAYQITVDPTGCNVDVDNNPATDVGGLLAGTGFEAQDRNGDELRNAPDWTFQLGAVYDERLTETLRIRANGAAVWMDEHNADPIGDPLMVNDAHWKLNVGVGVYADDDSWALDLIARNLTDERIINFGQTAPLGGRRAYAVSPNPPRDVMIRLTIRPSEMMK